ncbi:MAG TPA: methyl-accepting chemotaxis protein [bacterium]|mgnify:CR=1 FL=1|nr:methyl-accepting chemotaxis protein [bacterium]HOL47453.1 methyl-accepting chemotaxis protein [bacterium]HPQ18933.1 methyl-accepting chemotaxis protein [bacterium]
MKIKTKFSLFLIIIIVVNFYIITKLTLYYFKSTIYNRYSVDQQNVINTINNYVINILEYEKKIVELSQQQFNPLSEQVQKTIKEKIEKLFFELNIKEYYIINSKGTIIIMPFTTEENVLNFKDNKGDLYFIKIIDSKQGNIKYIEPIKKDKEILLINKITYYTYVKDIDWIIGIITNEDELLKSFENISDKIQKIEFIILIISLIIIIYILNNSLNKPINEIKRIIERIKEGKYDINFERIKKWKNELSNIALGIDEMRNVLLKNLVNLNEEKNKINEFLTKLSESIIKVSEGDLTKLVTIDEKNDINNMAKFFNYAIIKFNKLILKLTDTINLLTQATYDLQTSSSQLNSIMQGQTSKIKDITSAINETTSSISDIASNSKNAQQISTIAKEKAKEGGISVQQAIDGMEKIQERVQEISRSISLLGESGQQIGKIVGVITQISDQTSLLALNAAIEAARAGEQGRGFAVVADEVGKLAKRVAESAKEIQELIGNIQQQTDGAVKGMQKGMEEVAYGTDLVQRTGQSLNEIISVVDKTGKIIDEIANTVNEQSKVTDSIAQNANKIIENATEVNRTTEDSVNKINNLFISMKELQALIEEFNIIDKNELKNYKIDETLFLQKKSKEESKKEDKEAKDKKGIKLADNNK